MHQIEVSRNFGGVSSATALAGGQRAVHRLDRRARGLGDVRGPDASADTGATTTPHIFKKPVTISGTRQAVVTAPSVGDEFEHQVVLRTIEMARDLEKAVIRSVKSGNTQGSAAGDITTMGGLQSFLTTINSTIAMNSFASNPIDFVNDLLQQCWNTGARDLDLILLGHQWKRELSATNASELFVTQDERGIERRVNYVTTDFYSALRAELCQWIPARSCLVLATNRTFVKPLRGRSFQREDLAKTGDSQKGHVVGEYTLEVHHPDKMAQARGV